jgi:hypothetical protein
MASHHNSTLAAHRKGPVSQFLNEFEEHAEPARRLDVIGDLEILHAHNTQVLGELTGEGASSCNPQFAHSHFWEDKEVLFEPYGETTCDMPMEDPTVEANKADKEPASTSTNITTNGFFKTSSFVLPKFGRSSMRDTEIKEDDTKLRIPKNHRSSLHSSKEETTEVEDLAAGPELKKPTSFRLPRFSPRSSKELASAVTDTVARQALERAIGCPAQRVALMDSLVMYVPKDSEIIQQVYFCYCVQEFAKCEDAVEKKHKATAIVKLFVHNTRFPIQALQDPSLRRKLEKGKFRELIGMHKRFTEELSRNEEVMRMISGFSTE